MNKTVLIVDDSAFIHNEMKLMLDGSEFDIIGYAKTAEEGIEMYHSLLPDVVTMDIVLPGLDGLEATKIILKNWKDARLIMVSSLAFDDTFEEAERLGSCGFLPKPFGKNELLTALRDIFEEREKE